MDTITPEAKKWHIIYTNPRTEKKVLEYLIKYKFEAYLPLIHTRSRWKDRWKDISKPMLTSYVFLRMDYWAERSKVLILPGVHHVVFYKGAPATVEDEEIEMMEIFSKNFSDQIKVMKYDALKPGKIVEVKYGCFAGKKAEVIKLKNKSYVVLHFPQLNQTLKAEVKIDDLGLDEFKVI